LDLPTIVRLYLHGMDVFRASEFFNATPLVQLEPGLDIYDSELPQIQRTLGRGVLLRKQEY